MEVVNFLLENLMQLLSENVKLIGGAKGELENLRTAVQKLKAFLDDAANFGHSNSKQWKVLVEEIHKTVYKAEDTIDKFLVQAKLHQDKSKMGRLIDWPHNLATVRNLAADIKGIHDQVRELRNNNPALQATPVLQLPKKTGHHVSQSPSLEDDEVVGFEEEANEVIKRLVEGPAGSLNFIPVVGMAGLGKATLARKICNDPRISYEFFIIPWVYVGQEYKIKDIYLRILKFFTKHVEDHLNDDVNALAKAIGNHIKKGGRCLIVLDDVWIEDVIDHVKKVFAENKKGHRIMMTTREKHVAIYANPEPHVLKFLDTTESFDLLVMRVFGKGSCPDELVQLGKNIAERCGGVPLAVVVIAGALRGRLDKKDWERVEKNVMQHFCKDTEDSCLTFVKMSYDRLPPEMQTCFLYCGVFPRGFYIPSWKLIRLWIAEGLIKPEQTNTLEDTAEFYLNDLVNRNLVIIMQKRSDGQIKTCRLHDMLYEFYKKEASDKWLFQEVYPTTPDQPIPSIQDPHTCRRLCIQPSTLDDFLSTKPSAEHIRSFYCFSSKQKQIDLSPNDIKLIHKAFPLIRVMDVESLKFIFSREFNQLFHLRYIAISGDFKALPPTFGKFWNLQTLVINTSTSESTLDVTADIWNLLHLRHLHTNIPAKLPPPSTTTGKASCLQTLSMVAPESCEKDVLAKACHVRKLSIRGQMAAFLGAYKGGINNLKELNCLEHLKLLNDVLFMNKALHLPPTFSNLVSTVKKLTLTNTRFAWSEADKLGMLESLEVLKFKENAFAGDYWKPKSEFSALQVLWIERSELESWEASYNNFPVLRHLVLISCDKLDAVPLELADIPSLQEMRLESTGKAVKSAKDVRDSKTSKSKKFKLSIFPPENESKVAQ